MAVLLFTHAVTWCDYQLCCICYRWRLISFSPRRAVSPSPCLLHGGAGVVCGAFYGRPME